MLMDGATHVGGIMISRKKKICKGCNLPQYLFSHGYCQRCWVINKPNKLYSEPAKTLSYKSGYFIPPRTQKRFDEEKEYKKLIREIDKEAEINKDNRCFFCGDKIEGTADHHHLIGKEGDLLTDRAYIVRVHRGCHQDYHNAPVKSIAWFMRYISRVTLIDPMLASRELEKYNK